MIWRRLRGLFDVRRWRVVVMALSCDTQVAVGFWEDKRGRPRREAVVALIDGDDARLGMAELAEEQLPAAIRSGLFDGMEDWLVGPTPLQKEPDPGRLNDPRRLKAGLDVYRADAFIVVTASDTGVRLEATATILCDNETDRQRITDVADGLGNVIRHADLASLNRRRAWRLEDTTIDDG